MVFLCIACIVLSSIALHGIALHRIAWHCIAFDYLLWYCMVLQRLHGVLQLIWRAGELRRSASSRFYCLYLNVFVVDMIIVTRECAESDLVQDFVTFHVFFDFEHIPEQVCSQ